jgi:hypothetical protein
LILLTVFELLPKTCNFTICSIFINSGHVGWCTASPDTILKLDPLVMIQTNFGFHWSSTFRGEDFWKSLRRTTTSDGNSSPDPMIPSHPFPPPNKRIKKHKRKQNHRDFTFKEQIKFQHLFYGNSKPDNVLCILFVTCHKSTIVMQDFYFLFQIQD